MTNTITVDKPRRGRPPKAVVGRPPKVKRVRTPDPIPPFDWELLVNDLKEALNSSIKENKELTESKAKIIHMAHELEKQVVGLEAVVELLERKLDRANNSV